MDVQRLAVVPDRPLILAELNVQVRQVNPKLADPRVFLHERPQPVDRFVQLALILEIVDFLYRLVTRLGLDDQSPPEGVDRFGRTTPPKLKPAERQ